ncbi:hypothetical protein GFY24_19880 [Nocardia sp. SYP-A9097]|uniref:hypothetical protein n=1 Tax=Nocardia sp. SYP-A9097 TaxID=2663237 RepID=UPI00129BBDF2|nr:hypothetical protein [Nocardia sp. SYP-A9097]MRH89677.1 hypothetical protein [Nocardia sp. SYP-A9097]
MGNKFGARAIGASVYFSNGGTEVFFDVMALAGTPIARTPWEQHLVLYFCDFGGRQGRGTDGFDLDEIPWTGDRGEYSFFTRTMRRALRRDGWHRLHYEPVNIESLQAFAAMLEAFSPAPVDNSWMGDWAVPPNRCYLEICSRHSIFHGELECRLCDTGLQPSDAPLVWTLTSSRNADGVLVDRALHQIPAEWAARALEFLCTPMSFDSRACCVRIAPAVTAELAALLGICLDPTYDNWLSTVIA